MVISLGGGAFVNKDVRTIILNKCALVFGWMLKIS